MDRCASQSRQGKAGAAELFASLVGLEFHNFVPKAILEGDGLIDVEAMGKRFLEEDEVHLWHFNDAGRVVRFRHRVDTLRQWEAWRG